VTTVFTYSHLNTENDRQMRAGAVGQLFYNPWGLIDSTGAASLCEARSVKQSADQFAWNSKPSSFNLVIGLRDTG